MTLHKETCEPCRVGGASLPAEEAAELARAIPDWTLLEKQLQREFLFKDFREAMAFVNHVADAANETGHHPDILVSYNRVKLTLFTHKVGGLTRNDFILAAKIDMIQAS